MNKIPEHSQSNLRKLEKLIDNRDYKKAIKLLNRFLEQDPQNPQLFCLWAKLELGQGNNEIALEKASIAFQLNSGDLGIALMLALALHKNRYKEKSLDLYFQLNNAFPEHVDPLRGLEQHFAEDQDYLKLFYVYRQLQRLGALTSGDIDNLEYCLSQMSITSDDSSMELDILELLADERINPTKIHDLACSYLIETYHLAKEDAIIDLDAAAEDDVFKLLLQKSIIRIPVLDDFCMSVRKKILNHYQETGVIAEKYHPIATALAQNNWYNEYIQPIQQDEQLVLSQCEQEIVELLNQKTIDTKLLDGMMLLAMYKNLWQHPISDYLNNYEESKIPQELFWLYTVIKSLHKEIKVAQSIKSLTEVQDDVSLKVKEMYEENPYPRWVYCSSPDHKDVLDAFRKETANHNTHFKINLSKPKILIAGCGTGYEIALRASILRNAKVTAIDISRRSIAYAKIKAEELDLNHIKFYQADILELDKINERYDVILCSGVLHHLADPMKGWHNLRALLNDNGIMRIALYSSRARSYINKVRNYAKEHNMEPSLENVRIIRHLVFSGQIEDNSGRGSYILRDGVKYDMSNRSDFCAFSNCRDLIFHVQEKQYTIPELKSCLEELSLEFIGFSVELSQLRNKERFFSTESAVFEIDYWDEVEKENPNLFAGMYQFWCQAVK